MVAEEFADTHPGLSTLPLSYRIVKEKDHLAGVGSK